MPASRRLRRLNSRKREEQQKAIIITTELSHKSCKERTVGKYANNIFNVWLSY